MESLYTAVLADSKEGPCIVKMSGEKEKKRQHSKKCIGRRQKSHKSQPTLVTQTVQETNNHAEVCTKHNISCNS